MIRRRILLAVALTTSILAAAQAEACRWGTCRACRNRVIVQKPVQPVVERIREIAVPQQVTNVSVVYPAGATQYTLGQAAQVYALTPDLAVSAASRLAENAVQGFYQSVTAGMALSSDVAAVAKLHAAQKHLETALGQAKPTELTLKITQSGGGIKVERVESDVKPAEPEPTEPATNGSASLLTQHCAECHGTNLTNPKGGLFLGPGVALDGEQVAEAIHRIRLPENDEHRMPRNAVLPPEARAGILNELLALSGRVYPSEE